MCACSHFSICTTNLFTCRLTYLAPFARAQFLVKLGGSRLTYWDLDVSSLSCRRSRRILFLTRFFFLLLLLLLLLLSSSSSFFWQHIFFTHFPTSDFDQTCSQCLVPITTTRTLKMVGSGVTMGSLGSKRSFSPKTHQVLQIT